MLIFGAAATGLCYGTIFTLMPAATADFYGVKNLGVNYGILFTAFGVAGVLGSMLGGRVRDLTQTYGVAYLIVAGALVLAALLRWRRGRRGRGEGIAGGDGEGGDVSWSKAWQGRRWNVARRGSFYKPASRRKEWNMAGRSSVAAVLGAAAALALGTTLPARTPGRRPRS